MFKIIILVILALILLSLASGAIFLFRDDHKSNRLATSLTIRIVLSIGLFLMIMIGYLTGQIHPNM